MSGRPITVTLTTILIMLNALIWFALGIIIAVNAHPALPVTPELKVILAVFSFIMAGILVGLFVFLNKGNQISYYLTIAFFAVVSLLTIFDDVGLSDIFILAQNIIPIGLLIKDRNWYRKVQPPADVNV
jgi:hypothetical protein